jgi:hypothetical protein
MPDGIRRLVMSTPTLQPAPRRDPATIPWQDEGLRQARERLVDDELDDSFPASDPPSWVQGTAPRPH